MTTRSTTPRIEIIGSRGYYRARCPELGLYREHRTKKGALVRINMAIRAALARVRQ